VISYYGHSRYGEAETDALLDLVRLEMPEAAWDTLHLTGAERIDANWRAIALEFGIAARCRFRLSMLDKTQAHRYRPALIAATYRIFGSGQLLITWELDSVVAPPTRA
jgi:hypothetical protein